MADGSLGATAIQKRCVQRAAAKCAGISKRPLGFLNRVVTSLLRFGGTLPRQPDAAIYRQGAEGLPKLPPKPALWLRRCRAKVGLSSRFSVSIHKEEML